MGDKLTKFTQSFKNNLNKNFYLCFYEENKLSKKVIEDACKFSV